MTLLLSIVISWAFIAYTNTGKFFSEISWFEKYQQWMLMRTAKWAVSETLRRSIITVLPLMIFAIMFAWLSHFRVMYFLTGIVFLLYGMSYQEKETVIPSNGHEYTRFIFSQALSRSFTTVFWFVLLGPFGIVLYDFIKRARLITSRQILEWPAARILGLGYALAGHFPPTFSYWSFNVLKNIQYNQLFLEECGLRALNALPANMPAADSKEALAASALVKRAEFMLLIILLILVMGGLVY
jgi:hypothetical protein